MNLKRNLGTNVSMLFLLGLTIIAVTVWHVANGALDKLNNNTNEAEIHSLL